MLASRLNLTPGAFPARLFCPPQIRGKACNLLDIKKHNRFYNNAIFLRRGRVDIIRLAKGLLLLFLLNYPGFALSGDKVAGEVRYNQTCINCHGPAGKGVASYPKISGNDVSYTTSKLETYRDGIKVGPNSALMFMFAKPLTDEEIANLAAYLKDAKYETN